ncbi:hypothetical protein PYK79_13415 [Streptomyces sp. ID05-04B]|uniref:hypothetical protein n=1 Tax=Streptomyces sp. ID05-04B TaxID=3028661 RepID=UPI0029C44270|nr:hypothetical protein [Streptomyces sp. ID05-04B]MDX5564145.1 hypothetical protein [Streptomyces sp. ID05-04B]
MHIRTAAAAAVIATAALTGCAGTDTAPKATATASPSATHPGLTDQQKADARKAAGIPPTPKAADWAAYIKALNAIDTDIVHGKEDKAVSRGISSCSGYKRYPGDTAKQVKTTGIRFSSPDHPEGRDIATATKILNVAHKYICPDF